MVLKILQWNLKGYYNNLHELQLIINKYSPDIIALQETHLTTHSINLNNYAYSLCNTPTQANAKGGTALFVKKSLQHNFLPSNPNMCAVTAIIKAEITVAICSIYITPGENIPFNDLRVLCDNNQCGTMILGDFNAHSKLWGSPQTDRRGTVIENFLLNSNMCTLNDGSPTHFSTRSTFTHIDLSLVTTHLRPFFTWEIDSHLHGSDHFPIFIELSKMGDTYNSNRVINKLTRFNTDQADWAKFQTKLETLCEQFLVSSNINKTAAVFHRLITVAANESIPRASKQFSKHTTYWWNEDLSNLRNLKTSAWREFKKQPTVVNRIAYKKANAVFKRECKAAKRNSFTKFTESINPQTSVKVLWDKVNKLYGKATPLHVRVLETEEGGTVTDPHNIAQSFASTWSEQSKDSNFASSFISNKSNINLFRSFIVDTIANFLEDPITLIEFDSALNTAKGKSAGFDKISYSMLKHLPYGIKQRYIQLYNEIFQIGYIPQEWKTATVLPILKPGKPKTEVNGYRPISLLSCPAKILEKIVAKRLTWFLSKRKLISPHQMAFKSGKSTLDALLHIDNQIAQSISRRHHISILSVDFGHMTVLGSMQFSIN